MSLRVKGSEVVSFNDGHELSITRSLEEKVPDVANCRIT